MQIIEDNSEIFVCNLCPQEVPPNLPYSHPLFPTLVINIIFSKHLPEIAKLNEGSELCINIEPNQVQNVYKVKIVTKASTINKVFDTFMWTGKLEDMKSFLNHSNYEAISLYKYDNSFYLELPKSADATEWLTISECHPNVIREHGEPFIKSNIRHILNEFY